MIAQDRTKGIVSNDESLMYLYLKMKEGVALRHS